LQRGEGREVYASGDEARPGAVAEFAVPWYLRNEDMQRKKAGRVRLGCR
jgi:hypothetical protein